MKVATWNVNGIRARQGQFAEWVALARPDVICLQEIKASKAQVPAAICELDGYWCYWHGAGGYSGVSLHLDRERFPSEPEFSHPELDYETRVVQAEVPGFVVASVYVPNGGKDFEAKMKFLSAMKLYASQVQEAGKELILCGDLNVAHTDLDVHPKERKPNIIGQRPDERALFSEILDTGLVDVARSLAPGDGELFTWWAPWRNMKQRNIGWRIDYILATSKLAEKATDCSVFREIGTSDHGPLVATFSD